MNKLLRQAVQELTPTDNAPFPPRGREGGVTLRGSKPMELDAHAALPQGNLRRVVTLLRVVVLALTIAFCYYASSFCITIVLACFFSILVDPIVKYFERG